MSRVTNEDFRQLNLFDTVDYTILQDMDKAVEKIRSLILMLKMWIVVE